MVRQKSRKTIEELYAAPPSQAPLATSRFDENLFQNSKNNKKNKITEKVDLSIGNCRSKSKGAEKKDEKTFLNEERLLGKASKIKKGDLFVSPSLDNKNLCFVDDNEKDEDTEEFFELIKETVENAVGKTLSDILNRNFREVTAKIDDLKEQMLTNETKLEKLQTDMINKIVHYGEENSRHFRYLCMKSEYDKMFYQHQNIMTAIPVDARPNIVNPYPPQFAAAGQPPPMAAPVHLGSSQQPIKQQPGTQQAATSQCHSNYSTSRQKGPTAPVSSQCNCHNSGCGDFVGVERSKTSVSTKSSEMGVKEVKELLEQLQKFYEHQQNQDKDSRKDARGDICLNIQDDSGDGDEDDSSDDLSSPSIEEKLGAAGDS